MGHSYRVNFVHCVFSTKERAESIPADLQPKLWAYISGICNNDNIQLLAIGGTSNHVHLLLALPAAMRLSEAINRIKSNSSRWVGERRNGFAWQEGYGAFSVGASQLSTVRDYVRKQEVHHRKRNFEQEFVELLERYGVSFNPKYMYG